MHADHQYNTEGVTDLMHQYLGTQLPGLFPDHFSVLTLWWW